MNTPPKCQRCQQGPSVGQVCRICHRFLCHVCRRVEAVAGRCEERARNRKWGNRLAHAVVTSAKGEKAKLEEFMGNIHRKDRMPRIG